MHLLSNNVGLQSLEKSVQHPYQVAFQPPLLASLSVLSYIHSLLGSKSTVSVPSAHHSLLPSPLLGEKKLTVKSTLHSSNNVLNMVIKSARGRRNYNVKRDKTHSCCKLYKGLPLLPTKCFMYWWTKPMQILWGHHVDHAELQIQ